MHFKFRHLQKIVGAFFLLACAIVVVMLVLVARGKRWFEPYAGYSCYFDSGGGLRVGGSVTIQGLEAGTIRRLSIEEDNRVHVGIEVFRQHEARITEGSRARLSQPVIGSSRIEIALGPKDAPVIEPGGTIPSEESAGYGLDGLIESANRLVAELESSDGDLMKTLANVSEFTKALAEEEGSVRMLVERRKLYDDLESAAGRLDSILASVDEKGPEISDAISEARKGLAEANKVIAALKRSIFLRGNIREHLEQDSTLRSEGRMR